MAIICDGMWRNSIAQVIFIAMNQTKEKAYVIGYKYANGSLPLEDEFTSKKRQLILQISIGISSATAIFEIIKDTKII